MILIPFESRSNLQIGQINSDLDLDISLELSMCAMWLKLARNSYNEAAGADANVAATCCKCGKCSMQQAESAACSKRN